jgi:hypothetical protein
MTTPICSIDTDGKGRGEIHFDSAALTLVLVDEAGATVETLEYSPKSLEDAKAACHAFYANQPVWGYEEL